eukprot:1470589-Prymnesium_polylepis.1
MGGNQSSANGAVDTDGSSGFGGCAATSTSRLLLAASVMRVKTGPPHERHCDACADWYRPHV